MEDGVVLGDVHDGPVRKDLLHGVHENFPFVGGVKIVAHEEAAAQQELAEFGDLRVRQFPVPDFDGVQPRVVEHVVVIVQIDRLLHGARVNARQPVDGGGQVAVGTRIVDGPVGVSFAPVESAAPARLPVEIDARGGVHEAGEGPLPGHGPIRGKREIEVLPRRILAERTLRKQRANQQRQTRQEYEEPAKPHLIPV